MNPGEFLESVVRPNRADLAGDYASLRRAFNAVASVDALAAQLFDWLQHHRPDLVVGGEDDTQFRRRLAARSPEFRLVRDIAKAQKHVHLKKMTPLLSRSDQVVAQPIGFGEGRYGEGRFGGPEQVVVKLNEGSPEESLEYVETTLDRAIVFLECELRSVGAIV